jgi:nucleoside phosphorylase
MEAYSIAKACLLTGTQCDIWKYISDKADENANVTWKEQVAAGEVHYDRILDELKINLLE